MINSRTIKLIAAAKAEKWELIDKQISEIASNTGCLSWAENEGLKDKDGNVRDLAVSILEKTTTPQSEKLSKKLYILMEKDSNPYVRYRAAFALASHKSTLDRNKVLGVLRTAQKDPEVAEIAKSYLGVYK